MLLERDVDLIEDEKTSSVHIPYSYSVIGQEESKVSKN